MRDFYTRVNDGEKIGIEVDVDVNAFGYSSNYSWLLSIFIKFDLESAVEEAYEEFLEIKESLVISLEHEDKAKYVGSRLVDGWSELYFYAKDSKSLDKLVTEALKSTNYAYESSTVKDTKWDFHYKNLAPTELELAHIQSEKIINLLLEEEDDLSAVREVEHYVSFELPTQKNRFVNTFTLEGFEIKDEISSEEFEHGLALIKEHSVSSEEVQKVVIALYEAVQKNQGFYEGWSTVLATEVDV
ncbi:DUF695 domain-containing protein [Sulfurimonas sp.]|uniref:DUF695 domain-containing protein n=1 Tax=Sulfurimonas sp. TaxID=2022749 RepID=UPI0025E99327|nr:DUF695 domain-containing protein [Sulfurimonas sp.]MBT5935089.1 DUF695 domain-containing protein [Sulfurimonas sp.]